MSFDITEHPRNPGHYTKVLRSPELVGYAKPKPPFICFDRTGRWRNAHDFDLRDRLERCVFCGKRPPKEKPEGEAKA